MTDVANGTLMGGLSGAAALSPACQVGKVYMDYVQAQDAEGLRGLFSADVEFTGPDGVTLRDRDQIAAGYRHGFGNMKKAWRFRIENLLPFGDNGCLMEFSIWSDEKQAFVLSAVDRFELDADGKIKRFLPYFSSVQIPMILANINH